MTSILELNDADLTLYQAGAVSWRAPAIAVATRRGVVFGEAALRLSRIHPRQTNQHYLTRLNADPLDTPVPGARNHADLAWLHLRELAPRISDPVLLAVPGVLSADQLGLLLGILQEAGIAVAGFVDSAVAAAATLPVPDAAWHLDILLQRASLTALKGNGEVQRRSVEELSDCGLMRLLDDWIGQLASRFIRETRFDPLHAAATEQQLFDQLYDQVCAPAVLTSARPDDLVFDIHHGAASRRIEVPRAALAERLTARFADLTRLLPSGATVLLSARAAALPGLAAMLAEHRCTLRVLPADAVAAGCTTHWTRIIPDGPDLLLVTRLPAALPEPLPDPTATPAPGRTDIRDLPNTVNPTETSGTPGSAAGLDAAGGTAALASSDTGTPAGNPARLGAPTPAPANAPVLTPTHVLQGAVAWPLTDPALPYRIDQHGPVALLQPAAGLCLNDMPIRRATALEAGDRISLAGITHIVIAVMSPGGS